jgi:hypothetical protein
MFTEVDGGKLAVDMSSEKKRGNQDRSPTLSFENHNDNKDPLKKKTKGCFCRAQRYTFETVAQRQWHKKRTLRYLTDVCAGKMRHHLIPIHPCVPGGDSGPQYIFL